MSALPQKLIQCEACDGWGHTYTRCPMRALDFEALEIPAAPEVQTEVFPMRCGPVSVSRYPYLIIRFSTVASA